MRILSVLHPGGGHSGVLRASAARAGAELVEWTPAAGDDAPAGADALVVFGGGMNVHEAERLPWLRGEIELLRDALADGTPVLGVCLGAQLLAKAAHAPVFPSSVPEIGWHDVELDPAAADDPVLGRLPARFEAFQWHFYTHGLPAGAEELGRSTVCTQAFRLGERAWGVQFHPEVTFAQVEQWVSEEPWAVDDGERLLSESRERIASWNDLGRGLCGAFVEVAERVATPA
jgi:GMP synthase-like glutamine amidotransferase